MKVTASKLRENIYGILDNVLKTGVPIEIERNGKLLKIVPEKAPSKLARLKKRKTMLADPESFIHMDWLGEWTELK
jgi:antitoxin (DNA-binding transcriptional repressor) of toxin-antitoxin stability system